MGGRAWNTKRHFHLKSLLVQTSTLLTWTRWYAIYLVWLGHKLICIHVKRKKNDLRCSECNFLLQSCRNSHNGRTVYRRTNKTLLQVSSASLKDIVNLIQICLLTVEVLVAQTIWRVLNMICIMYLFPKNIILFYQKLLSYYIKQEIELALPGKFFHNFTFYFYFLNIWIYIIVFTMFSEIYFLSIVCGGYCIARPMHSSRMITMSPILHGWNWLV